jgi:hypothetical protein
VHGSSCLGKPAFEESYSKANVIFTGTIIAHGKYGVWFRVDEQWKGRPSRRVYLYTGNLRNDLDEYFDNLGVPWLIYAYREPLYASMNAKSPYTYKLRVHACDRTTLESAAVDDIKNLRARASAGRTSVN